MSYWYIGSVYSKYPDGRAMAHAVVCREAARLIAEGVGIYSPIAHSHPIAEWGGLDPIDHEIWLPAERPKMDAACGLIVLKMDGWQESYGLTEEIRIFTEAKKPILHMEIGQSFHEIARAWGTLVA